MIKYRIELIIIDAIKYRMFDAVIFDLDHTLFNRYGTLKRIAYLMKKRYTRQLNPALSIAQLGDMLAAADRTYIYHGWPVIFENLKAQGMFLEPPKFQDFFLFFMDCFQQVAVPIPHVNQMLTDIRASGRKVGLITNGSQTIQRSKLRMLGFENAFDEIIIGKEFGIEKPDPRPFEAMAQLLSCSARRMLYVGDHPVNDVEGARQSGYTPVWVKTSGIWPFPELSRAPYEINSVLELPQLLEKIDSGYDINR